jgi:hypothetical protein
METKKKKNTKNQWNTALVFEKITHVDTH